LPDSEQPDSEDDELMDDGEDEGDHGDGDSSDSDSEGEEEEWSSSNTLSGNNVEMDSSNDSSSSSYSQRQVEEEQGEEGGGEEEGEIREGEEELDELSGRAYQLFTRSSSGRPLFSNQQERVQLVLAYSRARRRAFDESTEDTRAEYQKLRADLRDACSKAYAHANTLLSNFFDVAEQHAAQEAFDDAGYLRRYFDRAVGEVRQPHNQRFLIDHERAPGQLRQLRQRIPRAPLRIRQKSIEEVTLKLGKDSAKLKQLKAERQKLKDELRRTEKQIKPLETAVREGNELLQVAATQATQDGLD
jgi:hypothetical protein